MENKYTPGPWLRQDLTVYALEHHGWRKGVEEFRNRMSVGVQMDHRNEDSQSEGLANAKLIAAAPDLLEALQAVVKLYSDLINSGDCGFWNPDEVEEIKLAHAAIIKATL